MKQRPFLKWAGSKYSIISHLRKVLPNANRLIEPFVGSGAVFINTAYPSYLLSDTNADLVSLFQLVKTEGSHFIDFCQSFFQPEHNQEKRFYEHRTLFNNTQDKILKSALFLYLNRHGFNGLCRYNASGQFNVPFGLYKKPYFPQKEMLAFHQHAHSATFQQADFASIMQAAQPGDTIYCDPPYVPLSKTAHFTNYGGSPFTWEHQVELARQAEIAINRGISVIISNHATPKLLSLYERAEIKTLLVPRTISCKGVHRKKVKELLAIFTP